MEGRKTDESSEGRDGSVETGMFLKQERTWIRTLQEQSRGEEREDGKKKERKKRMVVEKVDTRREVLTNGNLGMTTAKTAKKLMMKYVRS